MYKQSLDKIFIINNKNMNSNRNNFNINRQNINFNKELSWWFNISVIWPLRTLYTDCSNRNACDRRNRRYQDGCQFHLQFSILLIQASEFFRVPVFCIWNKRRNRNQSGYARMQIKIFHRSFLSGRIFLISFFASCLSIDFTIRYQVTVTVIFSASEKNTLWRPVFADPVVNRLTAYAWHGGKFTRRQTWRNGT